MVAAEVIGPLNTLFFMKSLLKSLDDLYYFATWPLVRNSQGKNIAQDQLTLEPEMLLFFFCLSAISWAAPEAHGGSQARGLIGVIAAGLRQSHSNAKSKPHLRPTPQLTAAPDL